MAMGLNETSDHAFANGYTCVALTSTRKSKTAAGVSEAEKRVAAENSRGTAQRLTRPGTPEVPRKVTAAKKANTLNT